MEFLIKGLVLTDIITNSSTVVYTFATNVDGLFNLFDTFMKVLGIDGDPRELFDITVVPSDYDRYIDGFENYEEFYDRLPCDPADLDGMSWNQLREILEPFFASLLADGSIEHDSEASGTSYFVKTKAGVDTKIGKMLNGLFDSREVYG